MICWFMQHSAQAHSSVHAPTQDGNVKVGIGLLLTAGADPNKVARYGRAALHMAAQKGHLQAVVALLRHQRTNKNLQDEKGCTPLHLAAQVRFTKRNSGCCAA